MQPNTSEQPADGPPAAAAPSVVGQGAPRRRWRKRILVAALVFGAVLIAVGLGYAENNVPRMSGQELTKRLDNAIFAGRMWVESNADRLVGPGAPRNPALIVIMLDIDRTHETPDFRAMVKQFVAGAGPPRFWLRSLDPRFPSAPDEMNAELQKFRDQKRLDTCWFIHALDPANVRLTDSEERDLYDPEKWSGYMLTHQLWALRQIRAIAQDPRVTDALIDRLCRRIAAENSRSLPVVDLYDERVAFLFLAGHPEMVRRRWIERIIENQRDDGGWSDGWFGFGSGGVGTGRSESDEHATLLALWALYKARYAFPERFSVVTSPQR